MGMLNNIMERKANSGTRVAKEFPVAPTEGKKREMINLTDDIKFQLGNWSCFLCKQKNIFGG